MPLTFKQFRELVAPYAGRAGKCPTSAEVAKFSLQVMHYLLYSGSYSGQRKLCIQAHHGNIALPPEVQIPIKVRIDRNSAEVWGRWFSFHSTNESWEKCYPAGDILIEDGTKTPLAYELPVTGSVIGVMGTCDEDPESFVRVEGKDTTGRIIYTTFKGNKTAGEEFKIAKNQIRYGTVRFGQITGVSKSVTNGYVALYAVNPATDKRTFLADWSPSETNPSYTKVKIVSRNCGPVANISMLCNVKPKDTYLDNELTLFDNEFAVKLGAQRLQAEENNDPQMASYKKAAVDDVLNQEAGYKKVNGSPVDIFFPLSGGAVKNIV